MRTGILGIILSGIVLYMPITQVQADPLLIPYVDADLVKALPTAGLWKSAPTQTVSLMAQPMAIPRPKSTRTASIDVQAVHNDRWVSFRFVWADPERSDGGPLGKFSDAVAIMFPVKSNDAPPPIFMGAKDNPVHMYHWRAQYQVDKDKGMATMQDMYPNMQIDMYPFEFKDSGAVAPISEEMREGYSPGRSEGNPQSYRKKGVDEIIAEGFGTSAVIQNIEAEAQAVWEQGKWTVVITRPLVRENGSALYIGGSSYIGLAVWQGGQDEVGSRKSVTMSWQPIKLELPPLKEASNAK